MLLQPQGHRGFVAIATVQGGVPKGRPPSRLHGCFRRYPQNFQCRAISMPGRFQGWAISMPASRLPTFSEGIGRRQNLLFSTRRPAANFSQGKQAAARTHRLGDEFEQ